MKPLKQVVAKGKNVRIIIELHEKDDRKGFIVHTKRLVNFKNRQIAESIVSYSVETFFVLIELANLSFIQDDLMSNKVLLRELNQIKKESKFSVSKWVSSEI